MYKADSELIQLLKGGPTCSAKFEAGSAFRHDSIRGAVYEA